jgi:hypothetical protein
MMAIDQLYIERPYLKVSEVAVVEVNRGESLSY